MPTIDPEILPGSGEAMSLGRKGRPRIRALVRQSWHCVVVAAMAVASYLVISHYLLQTVRVVGRSMVPTLHDSQSYLLNRWIYHVHAPRHADIVVLRDPSDNGFSIKRVIAAPGDSLYLKDGYVYVNGSKLNESYLAPGTHTFADGGGRDQFILCGVNQFFVLGDNRGNSIDSRTYGPVPRKNILGPIVW